MLFLAPSERGKGLGRQLLEYGIRIYDIQEVTVNEQKYPQAVGFYEYMGFSAYKRTDLDEEGKSLSFIVYENYSMPLKIIPAICTTQKKFISVTTDSTPTE